MTVQDKPERGDSRTLMWLGHHSIHIMLVYAPLAVAANLAQWAVFVALPAAAAVAAVAWLVSLMAQGNYHDERLCEKCIHATPLDTQKAVSRWKPALKISHMHKVGLVFFLLVSVFFVISIFYSPKPTPWWIIVINLATIAGIVVYFGAQHVHRKLYPWCPYCHWGDGGDEEISPDLPVGTLER